MAERITLNRKLPVVDGDWDAGAAKRRIFAKHTNAAGEFDAAAAADFFLIGDPDTGEKGDLHLPVGDLREGKSVIVAGALRAARSRLGQKETLPDVASDVRDRANDLAGALLEELRSRKDALATVHCWSTGVMLPIPSVVAAVFPPREGHTPHITLVHVEWASPDQTTQIMQIVADEVEALRGEEVKLGSLNYFERFEDRVAFVEVEVTTKVRAARDRIAARIAELDIEVSRLGDEWIPHATLDVVKPGRGFIGSLPTGAWVIEDVQVWHGDEHRSVLSEDEAAAQQAAAELSAPAVHTGSRNEFEAVRVDRAELGNKIQQANGWRRYPILYSRSGNVQEYPGPGGSRVREYRPESVVRSPLSMDTGVGVPWELRHSADLLTPDSVRGVALGTVLTVEAHSDGIHTSGIAQAWGRDLFEAIDAAHDDPNSARDVSVAFHVKVDPRPGTTDYGEPFDQMVTRLVWNSLASEPNGKAGTARVLTPRADATDGIWVRRADALLEIARSGTTPSKPVYYDLSSWVHHDAAHKPQTHKDEQMKLLMMLFKAAGKTDADIAKVLDITEAEVAALLSGETELTDEQMVLIVEDLVPRGEKPPEEPPREDEGDGDIVVGLRALLAKAEERADASTRRADLAEALASKHQDKLEDTIPRADAAQLLMDHGAQVGRAMELTHRSLGHAFKPIQRQDEAGKPIPLALVDWQRAAITGAYGDEAEAVLSRIDAKDDPDIIADNLADRVHDAQEILGEAGHTSKHVLSTIKSLRDEGARRADSQTDGLAASKKAQRELAAGTKPQAANGA